MCGDVIGAVSSAATTAKNFAAPAVEFLKSDTAAAIGTAVQAGAQVQAGRAQAKELARQADITRKVGEFEVKRLRETEEKLTARQRVAAAKSGVSRSGSVLEIMRQTAQDVEEEALNIQFGAAAGAQARLFESKQVSKAGKIGGVTTLLRGFGGN